MATTVLFQAPKEKINTVLIAKKGFLAQKLDSLPVAVNYAPFLRENPPKTFTTIQDDRFVTITEYDNKVSRNLTSLRIDLIRKAAQDSVVEGDSFVILFVTDKEQGLAAGLAVARNWSLYNKKTSIKASPRTVYIQIQVESGDKMDYQELQNISNGIRQAQRLMDTPCSELGVPEYVKEAQELKARLGSDVDVQVITGDELKMKGFGGIYGVGKAAGQSALVILSYLPAGATKTVAMVGKGIVYDTGGLSLKQTSGMCGMKHDMGGSSAVFQSFEVLVRQKVPKKVYALLCLAENAIGPSAVRNDDILYMYSGKTVEVNNTDAEGRLVLADGVAFASKHLQPDLLLDIATLTGAQLITTGTTHAGFITPSESIEKALISSGKRTGDLVFPMLYCPELLMSQFDSKVADMKNSVKDRMNAQSSCAGHFVESHLHADFKGEYLHIDMAGPGGDNSTGSNGYGVALLYDLINNF